MKTEVSFKKTKTGWRWTLRDFSNKKIIGASTEGYRRRIDAVNNLLRLGDVSREIVYTATDVTVVET